MFRVGEFARLSRASVKMLRHYDRLGLLRPAWTDPATGYRHYTASQLPRLNRILLLREVGFGLDEIRRLLDADGPQLDEACSRQEAAVERELAVLERRRRALLALRASAASGGDVAVVVRPVAAVDVLACRIVLGPGDDVAGVFDRVEAVARDAGVRADAPPLMLVHGRDGGGAADVEVAVPVTGPVGADGTVQVVRLPAVPSMACTVHAGGYGAPLAASLDAMLVWLDGAGYRVVDPVVRHVYLRFGAEPSLALPPVWLTDDADFVTELQVAVEAV